MDFSLKNSIFITKKSGKLIKIQQFNQFFNFLFFVPNFLQENKKFLKSQKQKFFVFVGSHTNNKKVSTFEKVIHTIEPYLALVEAIGSDDSPKRCLLIMAFVEKQPSFSRQYCSFSHHHNNLKLFLLEIRSYVCNRYFYDSQVWVGGKYVMASILEPKGSSQIFL